MNFRTGLCVLACLLAPALRAQIAAGSDPVGILSYDVPLGLSGLSLPLIPQEIIAAPVVANAGSVLTLAAAAGNVGAQLHSGAAYYVEILSGPSAGERFEVDTAATITTANATVALVLGGASHSTAQPVDHALVGARAAVRAGVTLETLAAQFSPALTGSDDPALADGVRLYGAEGFTSYYLRADGESWATLNNPADQRTLVVPPEVSLVLDLKSAPRQLVQLGGVRTNVFRVNLRAGYQAFATGFPVDLTPAQVAAVVDANQSAAIRWTGSNDAAAADNLEILDLPARSFLRYYLRADGRSWRRLGQTTDFADLPLLRTDSIIIVRRTLADATYRIAPPFSL